MKPFVCLQELSVEVRESAAITGAYEWLLSTREHRYYCVFNENHPLFKYCQCVMNGLMANRP